MTKTTTTPIPHNPQHNVKSNAFNQKNKSEYLYQAVDIKLIQNELMKSYSSKFIIHDPIGDDPHVVETVKNLIYSITDKPTLCVYNLGNYHWVTFAALKQGNDILILYKDSKGSSNEALKKQLEDINKNVKFQVNREKEQTLDLNCGIYALQNMKIMAELLGSEQKEQFIKDFEQHDKFCTLEASKDLRKSSFAYLFVLSTYSSMAQELIKAERLKQIRNEHQSKAEDLAKFLRSQGQELKDFEIKVLNSTESIDRSKDTNTITVEIETNFDNNEKVTYYSKIAWTSDINPKEQLSAILSNNDMVRVSHDNDIIKVFPSDGVSIDLDSIRVPTPSISLQTLCENLYLTSCADISKVEKTLKDKNLTYAPEISEEYSSSFTTPNQQQSNQKPKDSDKSILKNGSITPDTVYNISPPLNLSEIVTKLKEYNSKLNTEEILKGQKEKCEKYKTTYEKFKQATFSKNLKKIDKIENSIKKNEEELAIYKKNLENYDQALTNTDYCFIKFYQHECRKGSFSDKSPIIRHYGINTEKAKCLIGHIIADKTLHPLEYELLNKAVQALDKKCSLDILLKMKEKLSYADCADNVVLIDIFNRGEDTSNKDPINTVRIKLDGKVGGVETHTVVLWKTKDHEITLIDPTMQKYSFFLTEIPIEGYKIISGHSTKLYTNGNKTPGFVSYDTLPMKPRDCTDIAVKIGFEIGEQQRTATTIEEAKDNVIAQISNQKVLVAYKLEGLNTRALQSSSHEIRKESKKIIDEFLNFPKASEFFDFKKDHTLEDIRSISTLLGELQSIEEM